MKNVIFETICFFISIIYRLYFKCFIKVIFVGKHHWKRLKEQGRGVVLLLWHNDELIEPYLNKNSDITIMISMSKDGDLLSNTLKHLGYKNIRGSSSKGGKEALSKMIACLKEGGDTCFATDGPRGPRHKVKAGAVVAASRSKAPIIVTACSASNSFVFKKSWDRGILPLPFSKVAILYSEPIVVSENLSNLDVEKTVNEVEKRFLRLTENADNYFNVKYIGFSLCEKLFFSFPFLRKYIFFPISFIFEVIINIRNKLFDLSFLKKIKVGAHVISIGNITMGGTGKTPATLYFTKELLKTKGRTHKIAVVTRDFADESKMLENLGLRVFSGKKKYKSVLEADKTYKPDTIIVDDGFQHRYFHRDEDVVILNAAEEFKTNMLFPAGTLREPKRGLKRATKIIINRSDEAQFKKISIKDKYYDFMEIARDIRKINKKCDIYKSNLSASVPCDVFGKKVLLFSAIAGPEGFAWQVRKLGAIVSKQLVYPDHYNYCDKDYSYINSIKSGYDLVLTTEKDASKLDKARIDFKVVKIELKISRIEGV